MFPAYKLYRKEDIDAYDLVFEAFDTLNSITLYGVSDAGVSDVRALLARVFERCVRFQQLWNFTDPQSDIARINAAQTRAIDVDAATVRLLTESIRLSNLVPSFNVVLGSVTYLWKSAMRMPSVQEVQEALTHTRIEALHYENGRVWKDDPLLKVDIGGIAKGFIADEICSFLRECGVQHAKLDLGGSLAFVGAHPEGRPWRVRMGVPGGQVMEVQDCAVSSSGNNQRMRTIEGREFGHIMDPRTGMPAQSAYRLVSVAARSALLSDVLSTACMIVDREEICRLRVRFASDVIDIRYVSFVDLFTGL